jgi:hypothetical protein
VTRLLETLRDQVAAHFDDPDIRTDLKVACRQELADVQDELLALDRQRERERFLHQYIEEQVALADADTVADLDADVFDDPSDDDLRDKPLCTCPDPYCDLKMGELPIELQQAADFETGVSDFRQDHRGSPKVLDEADQAYIDRITSVLDVLLTVQIALSNKTHPSDVDDTDVSEAMHA